MTQPELLRCPFCGYTEQDARIHGDHYKCRGRRDAPWNKMPLVGSGEETPKPVELKSAEEWGNE